MKYFIFLCVFIQSFLFGQEWLSPDEVIKKLMDGNERYVSDQLLHPRRDTFRREATHTIQTPCAAILSCSDSRVPPEIIFDQGVGDLFVVRDAGNVAGRIEIDSLEYAAIYLQASLILVMGHEHCGAVKAVLDGTTSDIEAVAELIKPALEGINLENGNLWENAVKQNVRYTVKQIGKSSALQKMIQENRLKIIGGYYDLTSGRVILLD